MVYILGAGSSKDFGYPLGNGIFSAACEQIAKTKNQDIKTKLETAVKEVDQVMAQIYSNLPSDRKAHPFFEEILTFIWDSKKYEHPDFDQGKVISLFGKTATKVMKPFIDMLMFTFSAIQQSDNQAEGVDVYQKFIQSLKFNESSISFISLNYDLLLDNALLGCVKEKSIEDFHYGLPLDYLGKNSEYYSIYPRYQSDPGPYFHVTVDDSNFRKNGIALLKPHGSLNLSFCTGHKREGDFYYYSEDNVTLDIINGTDKAKCAVYNCHDIVTPLIIPPLYMKESYISETNRSKIWISKRGMQDQGEGVIENYRAVVDKQISGALQVADEIIIIGYSMPAYDFDFKSLLIKGLMANKNRSNVPVSIITKAEGHQLDDLKLRFKYLAGEVRVLGQDGFLNYMQSCKL